MGVYYRICRSRHALTAMDGEGARLYGGRWNPIGVAAVYLAESRALAALEVLVHAGREAMLLDWSLIEVEIPEKLIEKVEPMDLPSGWDLQPGSREVRKFGEAWLREGTLPALQVPSAVVPEEFAIVLRPDHVKVSRIRVSEARDFPFDKRLG